MADIELVIKLDEELYRYVKEYYNVSSTLALRDMDMCMNAIINGTPLPKGHGRLIDADKFLERVKKDREHESYLHSWTADMVLERLDSWYAPTVEAIPKDQYEARLKADMVAMLTEIQLEILELKSYESADGQDLVMLADIGILFQQKINSLKENKDGSKIISN